MGYSINLGTTKMCQFLRDVYWWNIFKKYIAGFVAKYSNFQQVKAE